LPSVTSQAWADRGVCESSHGEGTAVCLTRRCISLDLGPAGPSTATMATRARDWKPVPCVCLTKCWISSGSTPLGQNSGIGRENGPEGVEHFCQLTSVLLPMGYTLDS
jgi:hypothetical protein